MRLAFAQHIHFHSVKEDATYERRGK
jgi:hypothetical protein